MGSTRKKPTPSGSHPRSTAEDLDDAICLLALVTKRPPNIEGLLVPSREAQKDDTLKPTLDVARIEAPAIEAGVLQVETDVGVDGIEELDDLQIIDTKKDEQQDTAELQSKVLDCLAETLAKFKSDPGAKGSLDAKHVSSAMMIVYKEDERVEILCSKNEGLDLEDITFLRDWKDCMETIAKTGKVSRLTTSSALLSSNQELHRKKTRLPCSTWYLITSDHESCLIVNG